MRHLDCPNQPSAPFLHKIFALAMPPLITFPAVQLPIGQPFERSQSSIAPKTSACPQPFSVLSLSQRHLFHLALASIHSFVSAAFHLLPSGQRLRSLLEYDSSIPCNAVEQAAFPLALFLELRSFVPCRFP